MVTQASEKNRAAVGATRRTAASSVIPPLVCCGPLPQRRRHHAPRRVTPASQQAARTLDHRFGDGQRPAPVSVVDDETKAAAHQLGVERGETLQPALVFDQFSSVITPRNDPAGRCRGTGPTTARPGRSGRVGARITSANAAAAGSIWYSSVTITGLRRGRRRWPGTVAAFAGENRLGAPPPRQMRVKAAPAAAADASRRPRRHAGPAGHLAPHHRSGGGTAIRPSGRSTCRGHAPPSRRQLRGHVQRLATEIQAMPDSHGRQATQPRAPALGPPPSHVHACPPGNAVYAPVVAETSGARN